MASDISQLKSILKKSIIPQKDQGPTPREVAIHHAKLLEHRKQLEAEILDSLILLSEYPLCRDAGASASSPAPSDVADFKANIRLFQPSDYDDLIEERNINGLCGYSLCAKPKRETGPGGEWKITSSGEIVKRKELEKWCSQQCARRALFVKVQLNETAAWERAGIPDINIDLLDEGASTETEAEQAARKLTDLKLEDQRQAAIGSAALAQERGEDPTARSLEKVKVTLKEKDIKTPVVIAPTITVEGSEDHLFVDGHKTKLPERPKPSTAAK